MSQYIHYEIKRIVVTLKESFSDSLKSSFSMKMTLLLELLQLLSENAITYILYCAQLGQETMLRLY